MGKCIGCGAEVKWARVGWKLVPLDPTPLRVEEGDEEGDLFITEDGDIVWGAASDGGSVIGYRSHFATCGKLDRLLERSKWLRPEGL